MMYLFVSFIGLAQAGVGEDGFLLAVEVCLLQCVFACSSERRTAKTLNQCKLGEPFHSSRLELREKFTLELSGRYLPIGDTGYVPSGRIGGGSRCRQEDARPTISAYLLHGTNGGKLLGDPRGIITAQRNTVW